jgi:D-glucosaminate-specific PTS system IIB component
MVNIVLARIDDRLIHGQVMTTWVKYLQGNRIVIVDDGVAKDPFLVKIMKMAAPSGITAEIFRTQEAIGILKKDAVPGEKVIILAKSPITLYDLMQGGVVLDKINVGGMGACAGRKPLYKNISASAEEKEVFKKILDLGVKVTMQIVPDEKEVAIDKFL